MSMKQFIAPPPTSAMALVVHPDDTMGSLCAPSTNDVGDCHEQSNEGAQPFGVVPSRVYGPSEFVGNPSSVDVNCSPSIVCEGNSVVYVLVNDTELAMDYGKQPPEAEALYQRMAISLSDTVIRHFADTRNDKDDLGIEGSIEKGSLPLMMMHLHTNKSEWKSAVECAADSINDIDTVSSDDAEIGTRLKCKVQTELKADDDFESDGENKIRESEFDVFVEKPVMVNQSVTSEDMNEAKPLSDDFITKTLEAIDSDMDHLSLNSDSVRNAWVPDIRQIRKKPELAMTQKEFALRFGLKLKNVQNWEQGTAMPSEASRTLLWLIDNYPKLIKQLLMDPRDSGFDRISNSDRVNIA